ncbi:MAG: hypothetical protein R3337_13935, partial [Gammaproteobacteria bacterium]|nr:hypothetical protein [Gammaproteobacteria bacterium]
NGLSYLPEISAQYDSLLRPHLCRSGLGRDSSNQAIRISAICGLMVFLSEAKADCHKRPGKLARKRALTLFIGGAPNAHQV